VAIDADRWVLLVYRLPREPSTPRIALWRALRRLGAVQVVDGVAGLPLDAHTREQVEWLAEAVIEAGGEASVWLGEPASTQDRRRLVAALEEARAEEYGGITRAAREAQGNGPAARRALRRLRAELRRVRARDYLGSPARADAEAAVEELAGSVEVSP
jgi:hypothetical protein